MVIYLHLVRTMGMRDILSEGFSLYPAVSLCPFYHASHRETHLHPL